MRLFLIVIVCFLFAVGVGNISTTAQIREDPNTGKTATDKENKSTQKKSAKPFDISKVDFKNYTFPDFSTDVKTFTLKNSASGIKDVFPRYVLRKTYYFDLTGDKKKEAISHIIAEGCQMGCETSNLFYIHTEENNQLRLVWKIATGGDVLGGLKSAKFNVDEIIFEVFGDCTVENLVIKPEVDLKKNAQLKTTNFTRFVFSVTEDGFTQTAREVLPLPAKISFPDYRSQIRFGEQ